MANGCARLAGKNLGLAAARTDAAHQQQLGSDQRASRHHQQAAGIQTNRAGRARLRLIEPTALIEVHGDGFTVIVEINLRDLAARQDFQVRNRRAARRDLGEVAGDGSGALASGGCHVRTAVNSRRVEGQAGVAFHPAIGGIQRMHDVRRPGELRKPVGRGRVGHRNSRADAIEVRAHVGPVPSRRPAAIEHLRRVGLKEHAVDHAVAAQAR